jgi:hypothetical protein
MIYRVLRAGVSQIYRVLRAGVSQIYRVLRTGVSQIYRVLRAVVSQIMAFCFLPTFRWLVKFSIHLNRADGCLDEISTVLLNV